MLGNPEADMHQIMDAEREATMAYLDAVTRISRGGRRGREATPTRTEGLVYSHTRHATSRAGDPAPHDHVLVANVVEMLDARGGWKAPNTTLWRDELHAATIVGLAAVRRRRRSVRRDAPDNGPSGRLRQWAIAGVPQQAMDLHSKRSTEIDQHLAGTGRSRVRGAHHRRPRHATMWRQHARRCRLLPGWRQEPSTPASHPPSIWTSAARSPTPLKAHLPEQYPSRRASSTS